MEPSKILVLGVACGYDEPILRPFLRSTLRALPSGRIVLFVHDPVRGCPDRVASKVVYDNSARRLLRALPNGKQPLAARWSFRLGKFLAAGDPARQARSQFTMACFHYHIVRHFWYLRYLEQEASSEYTHVILADTRDLIIQRNPFTDVRAREKLSTGEEPVLIADSPVNRSWYEGVYGADGLRAVDGKMVLCAGYTMGPVGLVKEYLRKLCHHVLDLGPRVLLTSHIDQAMHNHVLHSGAMGSDLLIEKADGTQIATMSNLADDALRMAPDGMVRNAAGDSIAVIHQYDRYPQLKNAIEQVYHDLPT